MGVLINTDGQSHLVLYFRGRAIRLLGKEKKKNQPHCSLPEYDMNRGFKRQAIKFQDLKCND